MIFDFQDNVDFCPLQVPSSVLAPRPRRSRSLHHVTHFGVASFPSIVERKLTFHCAHTPSHSNVKEHLNFCRIPGRKIKSGIQASVGLNVDIGQNEIKNVVPKVHIKMLQILPQI